jgi:hypothetical protein
MECNLFGFGLKSKTTSVLKKKFNYPVTAMHSLVLKQICNEALRQGLNEYDAAILFMTVQINSITEKSDRANAFVEIQTQNMKSVMSLAKSPYSDLIDFVKTLEAAQHISGEAGGRHNGIHFFTDASEVPIFDENGRALMLRNRLCPAQIVVPYFINHWISLNIYRGEPKLRTENTIKLTEENYKQSKQGLLDKNASELLKYRQGKHSQIESWEIAYLDETNLLPKGLRYKDLNFCLFEIFLREDTIKPYGCSEKLCNEARKVFELIEQRRSRSKIVEPLHPYTNWTEVPFTNEIGYILALRNAREPEMVRFISPKMAKRYLEKPPSSFLINGPRDYEIGYYEPSNFSILKSEARSIYDSEKTVKPFGYSQKLVDDCYGWLEQMDKWFPKQIFKQVHD